jgi:chemotaxis protein CheX
MRYEFIEPLINRTVAVIKSALDPGVSQGDVCVACADATEGDLAIVIGLRGESEGSIFVTMGDRTALNIFRRMTGETDDTLTPLGLDAIAELANMVSGNIIASLNDLGLGYEILPPVVVAGKSLIAGKVPDIESFRVPLQTSCGEISVNVALRTN